MCARTYSHTHTHAHTHAHTLTHIHTLLHTYTHSYTHTHTAHAHAHTLTQIHTCRHTHTHTFQKQKLTLKILGGGGGGEGGGGGGSFKRGRRRKGVARCLRPNCSRQIILILHNPVPTADPAGQNPLTFINLLQPLQDVLHGVLVATPETDRPAAVAAAGDHVHERTWASVAARSQRAC